MADYWKSLPKKYCDFCKCWFADNKASVDFHERGFRHKGNVQRKLQELQRSGAKKQKEEMTYNIEMMKIEAMAMKSFSNDVSKNPELAKEYSTTTPMFQKMSSTQSTTTKITSISRYGEETSTSEESAVLVRGRQRAFETIAKKLEKKSKWLEGKTSEGKTYYWHRETMETKWEAPKSGFLSLEEQKHTPEVSATSGPLSSGHYDPYGSWKTVNTNAFDEKMVDLELPGQELPEIVAPVVEHQAEPEVQFKEKTIDSLRSKPFASVKKEETVLFKKRKSGSETKRNVRQRTDD